MKVDRPLVVSFAVLTLLASTRSLLSAEPVSLSLRPAGGQVQLSWPATVTDTNQSLIFPEYQVLYSTNLSSWQPLGTKLRGLAGRSGPNLNLSLNPPTGPVFYRLQANLTSPVPNETGEGG